MLTVVATIKARKDVIETVRGELEKLIAPTREEEGCIDYFMHRDNDDPSVFLFYENWESEKHLERHMATDHFKACFAAIDGMTEEIAVRKLTRLP